MRTQGNDNTISGQLQRRGLRPAYTVDSMPGMPAESEGMVSALPNEGMQARPDHGVPPEVMQRIQEMFSSGDAQGALGILMDHVGNVSGGMGPKGRVPNPQRRARRQKIKEDRMARRGAIKPKPVLDKMPARYDGPDAEMDGDADDKMQGSGPIYAGGGKNEPMPNFGKPIQRDPNQDYKAQFQLLNTRGNVPQAGGGPIAAGQDPDRRAKLMQYFQELGMK